MNGRAIIITKPCRLTLKDGQMLLDSRETGETKTLPVVDLELVMVESQQATLTTPLLAALANAGAVVVVCDERHLPAAFMLPLTGHTLQGKVQRAQMAKMPKLAAKIWSQVVRAKVANQAMALKKAGGNDRHLSRLAAKVDEENALRIEAQAARRYFNSLFGEFFVRDPDGDPPNHLLNYAYIVLRACMARALVSSGLWLGLGVCHSNQYNPYPLADDMMEPYRPVADELAHLLWQEDEVRESIMLLPRVKQALVKVMHQYVEMPNGRTQVHDAMQQTAAGVAQMVQGMRGDIPLPNLSLL